MHSQNFLVRHGETQKGKPLAEKMASKDLSLNALIDDNQKLTHFDLLKETSANQEEVLGEEEGKKILGKDVPIAMKRLIEKEGYVVKNRIMTDSPLTLEEKGRIAIFFEDLFDVPRVDLIVLPDAPIFLALEIVTGEILYMQDSNHEAEYQLYIMRMAADLLPYERMKQRMIMGD